MVKYTSLPDIRVSENDKFQDTNFFVWGADCFPRNI